MIHSSIRRGAGCVVAAVLAAFQIRCGGGGARDRTAFLGRLDASGLPLWVVPLFTNSESPSASEVAFVGDALFVTGYFDAPETLEGFTLTPTSANTADTVLLRVGADGAVEHALSYGSASADFVFQMSDSAAGIAVGGQFVESLTIDGRSVAPAAAGSSAYVATFNGDSELLQAHVVSATTLELSDSALGDDGSVLLGGSYTGTAEIGGQTFDAPDSSKNGFLALYDADGAPVWAEDTAGRVVRRVQMGDACEVTVAANDPGSELYLWRRLR